MTAPVFILPTSGPRTYRGKYPARARSVSSGTTGLHVELNDGTRLWTARPADHFADLPPYGHNMTGFHDKAVPMTAEQYETLKAAAELLRTRASYCGRGPRAEIESRVRRMVESIVTATVEPEAAAAPVRRDNVEYHNGKAARRAGEPETACPYLAGGERAARWTLGWNEGAPAVQTIDMTPTWAEILPALLAALTDGTPEGQGIARAELARMATIADSYVAAQKALRDAS